MEFKISCGENLKEYEMILNKYNFKATETHGEEIYKGIVEVNTLEEMMGIADSIRQYFISKGSKADDLLVITHDGKNFCLDIYDYYRD